jgi:dihydropteroate synthase
MQLLTIANHTFHWGERTYVMGILNITPDSFSGDGLMADASANNSTNDKDKVKGALERAYSFLKDGVDILDIGGESTRPGSTPVNAEEELQRVIPVIQGIASRFPDALISIDTWKSAVAVEALRAGACMVNDVWGLRADPLLAELAARARVPLVLMHNRSQPNSVEIRGRLGNAFLGAHYQDLLEDVKRELLASVEIARSAGIPDEHIILDPGIGFGKTVQQNLELINRLGEIRLLGFPVLLGPSRKSFIGYTLDLTADQRLEGTAATVVVGITRGADIVRVHDVKSMLRVVRMTDALVRNKGI